MNKIAIALVVGFLASAAHAADHNVAQQNTATTPSTAKQDSKTPAAPAGTAGQQSSSSQSRY